MKYCPDDGLFMPKHVGNYINTSHLIKHCAFVGVISLLIKVNVKIVLLFNLKLTRFVDMLAFQATKINENLELKQNISTTSVTFASTFFPTRTYLVPVLYVVSCL